MDTNFSVPLVPLDYFKNHLLPRDFLSHFDVDAVVDKLRRAKHIDAENRWKLFPQDPTDCHGKNEDSIFGPFALIAQYVATQARAVYRNKHGRGAKLPPQSVEWCCNPRMTPTSSNRRSTSKPDHYGMLTERSVGGSKQSKNGVPHWDDIVVPGETKSNSTNTDFNDNNAKIIWSLHQGMRETVQRRFMFGYTIENTDMRLWFCSRADIIVSETFNFISDHHSLVHFFLSIMFAPSDKLGYDPTIRVKFNSGDQKTSVYDIDVNWRGPDGQPNKATYITSEVVANVSVETLCGKGTRVWRGKEAGTGRKIVVKDCWIDSHRIREGDIFAEVLKAAEESSAEDLALFKKHFFTVIHHGDVFIDGERDNTLSLHRNGADLPTPHQSLPLKRVDSRAEKNTNPPQGFITVDEEVAQWMQELRYHGKSHYRIVFESEEECAPIDTVKSAYLVWVGMFGANKGLQVLHRLGFIHRDISAGNILVGRCTIDDVVVVKIVDLEFCKRVNDRRKHAHQGRTGTPYFIPVEVRYQRYGFVPEMPDAILDSVSGSESGSDDDTQDWTNLRTVRQTLRGAPPESHMKSAAPLPKHAKVKSAPQEPDFFSNPIHDFESLWWLAVYLVLTRPVSKPVQTAASVETVGTTGGEQADIVEPPSGSDKERSSTSMAADPQLVVRHWATRLLVDDGERANALKDGFSFSTRTRGVHEYLVVMVQNLNKARRSLVAAYRKAEANLWTTGVDLTEAVRDIHCHFEQSFNAILEDLYESGDFDFETTPMKFVLPSVAPRPTTTRSLDPSFALGQSNKRTHEACQSNSGEETSMDEVARHMHALESPNRARVSKRSKK